MISLPSATKKENLSLCFVIQIQISNEHFIVIRIVFRT